jgi:hypothetical protein
MRKDFPDLALSFYPMREVRNIPTNRLKWLDRESEREKLPEDHFLDPKNRRYPYKNKDGSINCYMLRSAIRLASMHGEDGIKAKAQELYKKYCGGDE